MGKWKFYSQWIWIAIRHPFGVADYIAGFLGILSAYIIPRYPQWQTTMFELAWQIPLGIFSALFVFRVVLSPYWMNREAQHKIINLERELAQATKEKEELQDKFFATPAALAELRFKGQSFRIAELAREHDIIKGRTFEDCHFHGPAVITLLGIGTMSHISFDRNLDELFIEVPERSLWGCIAFQDCALLRCTFHHIGIVGTAELKRRFQASST